MKLEWARAHTTARPVTCCMPACNTILMFGGRHLRFSYYCLAWINNDENEENEVYLMHICCMHIHIYEDYYYHTFILCSLNQDLDMLAVVR